MALELEQTQHNYDMESMSETHTMLRGEQKLQSRWPRTLLLAAGFLALTAVVVATALFASRPKTSLRKSSGSVVQLSDDSVWADVLSSNAMKQYEQGKEMAKEADKGASEAVESAKNKVEDAINNMGSGASKVVSDAQNAMKQKADEATGAAKNAAKKLQKAASSAAETAQKSPTQAEADAAAAAKALMQSLMGGDDSSREKMISAAKAPAPAAPVPALTLGAVKIPAPPKLPSIAMPKIQTPVTLPVAAPAVGAVEPPAPKPTDDPSKSALAPQVASSDQDPCSSDQELSGGLCYAKCSLLTQGSHPCRSSAWSCCAVADGPSCAEKASMESCWVHPGFCFGYAVAGMEEAKQQGSNCPTNLGGCLVNEEMFMSQCYKKCRDLTGGTHTKRVGAATCCNKGSDFECLWPGNLKSDPSYNVGGGLGDHNSGTPSHSHLPMKSLAQSD